ncbi:hypothetical protein M885DRAFT_622793 [Pelagophyceae sp. CCMP2097]|nr:hypothetical protein M885DRAFT_622793 [Pelagophyceae sp. CCMP2097]
MLAFLGWGSSAALEKEPEPLPEDALEDADVAAAVRSQHALLDEARGEEARLVASQAAADGDEVARAVVARAAAATARFEQHLRRLEALKVNEARDAEQNAAAKAAFASRVDEANSPAPVDAAVAAEAVAAEAALVCAVATAGRASAARCKRLSAAAADAGAARKDAASAAEFFAVARRRRDEAATALDDTLCHAEGASPAITTAIATFDEGLEAVLESARRGAAEDKALIGVATAAACGAAADDALEALDAWRAAERLWAAHERARCDMLNARGLRGGLETAMGRADCLREAFLRHAAPVAVKRAALAAGALGAHDVTHAAHADGRRDALRALRSARAGEQAAIDDRARHAATTARLRAALDRAKSGADAAEARAAAHGAAADAAEAAYDALGRRNSASGAAEAGVDFRLAAFDVALVSLEASDAARVHRAALAEAAPFPRLVDAYRLTQPRDDDDADLFPEPLAWHLRLDELFRPRGDEAVSGHVALGTAGDTDSALDGLAAAALAAVDRAVSDAGRSLDAARAREASLRLAAADVAVAAHAAREQLDAQIQRARARTPRVA